ncbi:hypothetical protein [Streptomyces sp. NPDC058335]|uniref:hypothetical protein n=1 Tax=Streptomyces sp. NPDC058335 TaxID=3346451 RepID=UPI003659A9D5
MADALPVQAHDGRLVVQVALAGVDDRRDEGARGLARVQRDELGPAVDQLMRTSWPVT